MLLCGLAGDVSASWVPGRPITHLQFVKTGRQRQLLVMDDLGQGAFLSEHTGSITLGYSLNTTALAVHAGGHGIGNTHGLA